MNRDCLAREDGQRICHRGLEEGYALYQVADDDNPEPQYRCYVHHEGQVRQVLVPQPLSGMAIAIYQESG